MKDRGQCQECVATEIKTGFELVGNICPMCKKGQIVEIITGRIS